MSGYILKPKVLMFAPVLALLILVVACGADATPTPVVIEKEVQVEVTREVVKEVQVVATPTPTTAPAMMEAKVAVLQISLDPVFNETNLLSGGAPSEHANQGRHWSDPLVEMDPFTGKQIPGLAIEWEMVSPDAKKWIVKLRKGVPFHKGFGEFTSRDVPHTYAIMAVEEGLSLDSRLFRDLMGKTERLTEDTNEIVSEVFDNIKVIDQYTVEYNLLEPTPDLDYVMSSRLGTTFAMSKLHWDSEGLKGYTDSPIGTGSWQYVGRKLSQYLELERVENHWEKTPDFKGLKLWWVGEPATRLAQLLAGEVQMATLPTSLYGQATGKGMVIFSSSAPANQVVLLFGGLYADDSEFYDPDHPFHNVKVREAINRSLNRDEMNRELFGGNGEVLYNQGFHPSQAGWNPDWEKNFERDYGYDPVRARELIAEAGYAPGEIKVQSLVTALAQLPEMGEIGEAMAIYMQDIGLDVEILELEFAAVVKIQRAGGLGGILVNLPGALHPPGKSISVFSLGFKRVPWSETTFIRDKYTEFLTILDPVERERRLLEMGQYKYDNYVEVPLFWLSGDVLADPAIIKDHHFSGGIAGSYTHWEYVEAVQK